MNLTEFIEKSSNAKNVEELYSLLERVLAHECGYDRVLFSLMSEHKSLGLGAGHGIMRNYPDDWMGHYIEHGYEHIDPVRRFGFSHLGPFIWDQLPLVMDLTPRQELCLNMGREAGLNNGAAVCLRGLVGEFAGIGVASSASHGKQTENDVRHTLMKFNLISQQFYLIFTTLHTRKTSLSEQQVELSARELEVMRLISAAKSDGDISDILKISASTVNFHTRNILRKFGTSHRISLVMKAMQTGIITPDEAVFVRKS